MASARTASQQGQGRSIGAQAKGPVWRIEFETGQKCAALKRIRPARFLFTRTSDGATFTRCRQSRSKVVPCLCDILPHCRCSSAQHSHEGFELWLTVTTGGLLVLVGGSTL